MSQIKYHVNNIKKSVFFLFTFFCVSPLFGQLPSGFFESDISTWNNPMDIDFDKNGRMYVAERAGKVFIYQNNIKTQILDISEEVAFYGDYGLMSIELDPDFLINGYFYLFYVVDRHHLLYYGTPNYSLSANEQNATIARVTRYTLNKFDNFNSLEPNSRFILIGETKTTGIPTTSIFHIGGDMKFGEDGSLIVSTGDAASGADYQAQALTDGIINQAEFDATELWRTQLQTSHNGKILRIDPANGNGLASNPFFETLNPRSAKSRIWALGLRNPFRIAIKPNTGSADISDGAPGTILVGDVGQDAYEEINTVTQSGQNFGWPRFEGFQSIFETNPSYHPAVHTRPTLEYGRPGSTARVLINGSIVNVGSTQFNFPSFTGGCIILGEFYEGTSYPSNYHNALFFGEYNNEWVKTINLDTNNNPTSKIDFTPNGGKVVSYIYNNLNESMYFINIYGEIKKITYSPNTNQAPKANFNFDINYGSSPLNINFDGSKSTDFENNNLTYNWNFGDNSTETGLNIAHQFIANGNTPQVFTVTLTVTDDGGLTNSISKIISVNNTPPQINSTSLDNMTSFDPLVSNNIVLNANISDNEEPNSSLVYNWKIYLVHNEHEHLEYNENSLSGDFTLSDVPCNNNLYNYRIELTVTDSYNLFTKFEKKLFPNCNLNDTKAPEIPLIYVENYHQNGFSIKWSNIVDDIGVKSIETFINGESQRLTIFGNTNFNYFTTASLVNKSFSAQIIVRDFAGNATKSSIIYFTTPNSYCIQLADTYLSNLDPVASINGFGPYERDKSNGGDEANDGSSISLNGIVYSKGLGVHPYSELIYNVASFNRENFKVKIGLDDSIISSPTCGSVIFKIYLDDILFYTSPSLTSNSETIDLNIDIRNKTLLRLNVDSPNNIFCDNHADWADAKVSTQCPTLDILAPTTPANLELLTINGFASAIPQSNVSIGWTASSDNIDNEVEYEIYLNGEKYGVTIDNYFVFPSLPIGMNQITIQAKDNFGNVSTSSINYLYNCPTDLILVDIPIIPNAVNDLSLKNPNTTPVIVDIVANDAIECGNIDKTSVTLTAPVSAVNIISKTNGDIISFEIPNEGIWDANSISGMVTFTPENVFLTNPTPINYRVKNTLGNLSNSASITVTYKCIGNNESINSGNWDDPSIWSCGSVPTKYNDVIINPLHTINIENISAIVKNITFLGTVSFGVDGFLIIEE